MNTIALIQSSHCWRRAARHRSRLSILGTVFGATLFLLVFAIHAAADVAVLEWGKPSNGLRCRVATVSASMSEEEIDLNQAAVEFDAPENLAFAVELENVSDQPISLLDTRYGDSFGEAKGKANSNWFGQFLFSIELLDDAGTIISSPNVEQVDMRSTLDGTLVSSLQPGSTHRFLLRPTKWLSVLAPRLTKGTFQAVVHYHGLPRAVANRIREYRPDSGALAAWSGDVASRPAAFAIAGSANSPVEGAWGEASNGLRAAVELVPNKSRYTYGQKIDLKLHLQNVGDRPITVSTPLWLSTVRAIVVDERDVEQEVGGRWYSGWTLSGRVTLLPNQTATLDAGNLGFAASKEQAQAFGDITNRTLVAPIGTYRIQLSGVNGRGFELRDGKGTLLAPFDGDWSGNLTTGYAAFVVGLE